MSLHDFSISESRYAEFFEHVFSLKKEVSTSVHVNLLVHDNVHFFASSSVVRDFIDKPRRSKRCKVEISFDPDFLVNLLIEDFDINFLSDEIVYAFFIEEDSKLMEKL